MATKAVRLSVVSAVLMSLGSAQAFWQLALHLTMQAQQARIRTCTERMLVDVVASDLPESTRPIVEATLEYQQGGAARSASLVDERPPGFKCAAVDVQVFISPLSPAQARFTRAFSDLIKRMMWGAVIFFVGLIVHTYTKHVSVTGGVRTNG